MGISTGSKRGGVSQAPLDAADGAPPIALPDVIGSLVLGVALAVSHPVLDLLSRNLAFFTAHKTVPLDVLGLALLLTIVLPLLVVLPVVFLMRLAPRVGVVVYGMVLGLLAAAASLPFVERLIDTPWLVVVFALGLGGLAVAACLRFRALQTLLRWGTAVPVVVLAYFVFASPGCGTDHRPRHGPPRDIRCGQPDPGRSCCPRRTTRPDLDEPRRQHRLQPIPRVSPASSTTSPGTATPPRCTTTPRVFCR